jgi:hypothetical protein
MSGAREMSLNDKKRIYGLNYSTYFQLFLHTFFLVDQLPHSITINDLTLLFSKLLTSIQEIFLSAPTMTGRSETVSLVLIIDS